MSHQHISTGYEGAPIIGHSRALCMSQPVKPPAAVLKAAHVIDPPMLV
ncbi:MAG TPA: hypothetical protein VNJ47_08065 [Nevskiales bacterium]|nr:hypothetical protein [Nevskiales bacterium]